MGSTIGTGAEHADPAREPGPLDAARRVLAQHSARYDGQYVVRLPETASLELIRTLASNVQTRLRQIVPLSSRPQPGGSLAEVVSRDIARDRRDVERVYVLAPDDIDRGMLDSRLRADRADHLNAKLVSAEDAPPSMLLRNTWLVDDSLVVHEDFTDDGAPVWTVDSRESEVMRNVTLWQQLWDSGGGRRATAPPIDVAETHRRRAGSTDPLLVSADQIASMAPMSCTGAPDEPQSCAWYHGVWQHLRLVGMVPEPAWPGDFFSTSISTALRKSESSDAPRVLISGAADYALLGETIRAIGQAASPGRPNARVAVLDRCATPIIACRWYAQRANTVVDSYECDVRDAASILDVEPFDVITSDGLLTELSADEAAEVLDAWRKLLRPRGRIVTTVRLNAADVDDEQPDDAFGFGCQVRERLERWRWLLRAGVDDIVRDAELYASRAWCTDLGSREAAETLFTKAGLEIVSTDEHHPDGAPPFTRYLRVVATV